MFKLRPYQKQALADLAAAFSRVSRVLFQLATGGGKTVIFNEEIKKEIDKGGRVLVIAHRRELISQARDKFATAFGIRSGVILAKESEHLDAPVIVASVQTLASWIKREKALPEGISLVVIDEAHRTPAATYKAAIEASGAKRLLGVTATPCRMSGEGFLEVFDELVLGASIKELEKEGFLLPPKLYLSPLSGEALAKIKVTRGDYSERQLAQLMLEGELVADVVSTYKKHASGSRCLTFAVSVDHSKAIVEKYLQAGISAAHVDGKTPKLEREAIFEKFEAGEILVLSNVGIATEGLDVPSVETVQLVRPTKSLSLYRQMCGRGARPFGEQKFYNLLDLANNVIEHGSPSRLVNWKTHFKGRKKREKKKHDERLVVDLETQKLYSGRTVPKGIELDLLEIDNDVRIDVIVKEVKRARKSGSLKSQVVSRVVRAFSKDNERPLPSFSELLIVAQLTGGSLRNAVNWSRIYGTPSPADLEKSMSPPKFYPPSRKEALLQILHEYFEQALVVEYAEALQHLRKHKNAVYLNDNAAALAWGFARDNAEIIDAKLLAKAGVSYSPKKTKILC